MQAELPVFESIEDALKSAVYALGGTKKVGAMLWPDKGIDASYRLLNDCLNPLRAEKLDLSQVMYLLRSARDAGCYAPFQWVAAECGFDARPVTRAEEKDRATAALEAATKQLQAALASVERICEVDVAAARRAEHAATIVSATQRRAA